MSEIEKWRGIPQHLCPKQTEIIVPDPRDLPRSVPIIDCSGYSDIDLHNLKKNFKKNLGLARRNLQKYGSIESLPRNVFVDSTDEAVVDLHLQVYASLFAAYDLALIASIQITDFISDVEEEIRRRENEKFEEGKKNRKAALVPSVTRWSMVDDEGNSAEVVRSQLSENDKPTKRRNIQEAEVVSPADLPTFFQEYTHIDKTKKVEVEPERIPLGRLEYIGGDRQHEVVVMTDGEVEDLIAERSKALGKTNQDISNDIRTIMDRLQSSTLQGVRKLSDRDVNVGGINRTLYRVAPDDWSPKAPFQYPDSAYLRPVFLAHRESDDGTKMRVLVDFMSHGDFDKKYSIKGRRK